MNDRQGTPMPFKNSNWSFFRLLRLLWLPMPTEKVLWGHWIVMCLGKVSIRRCLNILSLLVLPIEKVLSGRLTTVGLRSVSTMR